MPEVIQTRGACVESVHPVSAVAVRDGEIVWSVGDDRVTTFRSASKPFQLACSLSVLGDPPTSDDELAIGAASHSGEPKHVALVEGLLARFGVPASELRCGTHPPVYVPSAEAILRAGGTFSDVHNNCSGKHSFMLAAAAHAGWDHDYRAFDHPLQRVIVERLTEWMHHAPDRAVDGCGVPTFIQPLSAVARSWWRVARAMSLVQKKTAHDPWDVRLGLIGLAMGAHPDLSSGTDRLDLDVVTNARETMAVKVGAGGLFCIALPERGMSIALKVHSGVSEALAPLVAWALKTAAAGAWAEPDRWGLCVVRNVAGREVGEWSVREE
jgi:L-asparaginase II